ncbi:hypothetical protein DSCW_30850 [Desulfosarcina widdelii]|uniref:Uncharacterized protein n=1 Tax=Desulfosarcina widdelii TaxID=947919 RepID=A0A5K7Z3W4_9BACT|nr:hypothetical protein [Desulfosarcina widdelii]BBO75668.1 hypothetical protein DSCW_30850 [Desulfosarcina widdelii]
MKSTWEKIFEYASMPLHGTMSRKLRKGLRLQINEGKIYETAVLFLNEKFVRLTETEPDGTTANTYYDLDKIESIRTLSSGDAK